MKPLSRVKLFSCAAACALLSCFAVPSFAQLSTASVTGVVRDSSGSVLAGAKLTLTNLATTVKRDSVSNSAGNYLLLNIQPGTYSLEVTAAGFQTWQLPSITLAVNQTATLDVAMQVGALQQTVTVEASGELLQQSTAEIGAVIAAKQVVDLPLNGRNFTQLLSLSPGVAPVNVAQSASNGFGNVAQGTAFSFPAINGQTNRSNLFMTDGLINQGAFSSTYAVPPIIDSIDEFKVNGHTDLAEFGQALGGIINVATKSGTNDLHGTVWEYLRNSAFNARNTFLPGVTVFRQNQFGVSAGGPVIIPKLYNGKNKTFFFGAYEGFQYSKAANSFQHFPTDAELAGNLTGDPQAFDPFSTVPNGTGGFTRTAFPGNQIPANRIDGRLVSYVKAIRPPLFNTGNANNNAIDATPFIQHQNEFTTRIDQTIGSKDSFWFRYSAIYFDTSGSAGIATYAQQLTDNPGQNYGASWVHTFSPSLVLQAQYGRAHQEQNTFNVISGLPANATQGLGFDPNFAGNFIGGYSLTPQIGFSGYSNIPQNSKSLNPNETNVHQYKANVSKVFGSHTLRFGGEFNASTFESLYNNANVAYAQQQTSNPSNPSAFPGNSIASFLLNVPDNAGRRNVHETTRLGGVMGFYVQDSWKATSRLTVNLGLRYDRTFIPPYGREDTIGQNGGIETGSVNFNDGTYVVQKLPPSCTDRGHAPCIPGNGTLPAHVVLSSTGKIYHDTTTNWAPRVGLAYRATPTIAVRAGFGIYYDNWAAVTQTSQNYEGSWPDVGQQLANNLNVPTPSQATPTIIGQNPFAGGGGAFPAPTPFQQVQWFYDPYNKNPYSMQWNIGVAKQFNNSTTMNIDYVGSGSRRLDLGGYYNVALTPGPGDPTLRQPYTYIHPTYYDRSIGRGNYNALQFQFNRRFSGGLAYQVSYTYSKSIDIGSSGWYGVEGQSVQDPYNFNNDRSVSGFDLTHTLSVNILYELPIGKGKRFSTGNGVADYILGGWQINTITSARSGQPYNLTVPGDSANTGNTGYLRPNLRGDPNLSNPTRQKYFNTAAFAAPAAFSFGNFGRYRLRSSPVWNIDLSIFRQFPFGEHRSIEFRAESFNLPNTAILAAPTSAGANAVDPAFGTVTSTANTERTLQLGLKIIF